MTKFLEHHLKITHVYPNNGFFYDPKYINLKFEFERI